MEGTSVNWSASKVLKELKALANPDAVAGMVRFGINPKNTYGVSVPQLRRMARQIGKNHGLAQRLWASGVHEARILALWLRIHTRSLSNKWKAG